METKNIEAVLTTVTIDTKVDAGKIETVIGESAKMEVQKAVNYIQSGKAEIDAAVDARLAEIDAEGQEYVDLAKDWAIKTDGTVDGVDYSSKYYAQSILPIASDITTVAGISSEVSAVGGAINEVTSVANDLTNIDNVANDLTNIDTVAGISSDISTTAGISNDVTAVAGNATNINAVNANKTNINAVAGNATNINSVASNGTNINAVAGNSSNINTIAGISSDVTTVANNTANINNVVADLTNINNVASDLTNINNVASDLTNIDTVAADVTNIDNVAAGLTNIDTVASNISNVNAAAGDIENINAVAADLTNIDNASSFAADAKQWAIGDPSEPSGNSAKYWAEEADVSETNAEIWAEGTDEEVRALGGVHSSKGWANQSAQGQVQSDWAEADPTSKAYILNKPTIPTVNNATLTIQKNGTTVKTFTANASSNVTANITVPTKTSDITNDSGYITGINSSDVTTALGYTPANDSNVVKTSGNQTVGGAKTFTTKPLSQAATSNTATANQEMYLAKDTSLDRTVNPSYYKNYYFNMIDKNNGAIAYLSCGIGTSGSTFNRLHSRARTTDNSADVNCYIGVQSNRDGTSFTYAPTPATSDNSTKIATTAYVKAQGYALDSDVVKTSGNQTIANNKTFTGSAISQNAWQVKRTDFTKGDIPSSTKYFGLFSLEALPQDSSSTAWLDKRLGIVEANVDTSGNTTLMFGVYRNKTNAEGGGNNFQIRLKKLADNTGYAEMTSSPATGDNSTKIATTAFVNNWVTANTSEVAVVVESEESGYNGYRVWSDGWVEQWGATTINSANAWREVTLDKPYASNVYQVVACTSGTTTSIGLCKVRAYAQNTTTKFGLCVNAADTAVRWYACGQGA